VEPFRKRKLFSPTSTDQIAYNTANFIQTESGVWLPRKGAESGAAYSRDEEVLSAVEALKQEVEELRQSTQGVQDTDVRQQIETLNQKIEDISRERCTKKHN
jgi:hypothetical protein